MSVFTGLVHTQGGLFTVLKSTTHKTRVFCFLQISQDENRTGQSQSDRNTPGECFGARVRAEEVYPPMGDSRPGHQNKKHA